MNKIILALALIFGLAQVANAQVTGVTITGISNPDYFPGQSVAVTLTITNTNIFSQVSYDILFSAATTASTSAYSSYLQNNMVCTNADDGFAYNSGINLTNTFVRSVIVPASGYSGNIVILAAENSNFLTCSSATTFTSFTILNTPTPTNTATNTPTPTPTKTTTSTATFTTTATATNTANTPTATNTATNTATKTTTNTPTNTATSTTTNTATLTPTFTSTFTPTITNTHYPTLTPPFLPVGGQMPNGNQHVFNTDAFGNLIVSSFGTSPTVSPTFTFTVTVSLTPTNTFTPTKTYTPTLTYTPTNSLPIGTNTYTPQPTNTPTATFTNTFTYTPTATWTNTTTSTTTNTPTNTNTPTITSTPTPNGFQITSADMSDSVTFFFPRPITGFSADIDLSSANSTAITYFVYGGPLVGDQSNGIILQTGATQHVQGALGFLTNTTANGFISGAVYGATHLLFVPVSTPSGTKVATIAIQPTYSPAFYKRMQGGYYVWMEYPSIKGKIIGPCAFESSRHPVTFYPQKYVYEK